MPDGLVPASDAGTALSKWTGRSPNSSVTWRVILWTNAGFHPDYTVLYGDLVQPTWTGYAALNLDQTQWQAPTVSGGCFTIVYGTVPLIWFVSSTNTTPITGWAIYDYLLGSLVWVQEFDSGDQLTPTNGEMYGLVPRMTEASKPC